MYGEHGGMLDRFADSYYAAFGAGLKDSKYDPERLKDRDVFAPCLSCITPGMFANNLRRFIEDTFNPAHAARWAFKEVRYKGVRCRVFDMLFELFPTSQFIFLVRDPREQIQSIRSVPWGDQSPFGSSLHYWMETFTYFERCASRYPDKCAMINYQNLRDVREIFRWLELDNGMINLFRDMPITGETKRKIPFTEKEEYELEASGLIKLFTEFKWSV